MDLLLHREGKCENSVKRAQAIASGVILLVVAVFLCGGCHSAVPHRRPCVSQSLTERFGAGLGQPLCRHETSVPPGVVFDDGLTEDEAISAALWNNASYQELLADLGISRAQRLDAGLITDPQFVVLFPLGPKQLEFTTYQAVDALWLRPVRVRAAELDLNRVSQSMVQFGLDTIRDVRLAHADLLQMQQQADVARDAQLLRQQIADLARKRLDAGDISELEVTTTEIDALQARAAAARAVQDVQLAQHRLRTLLGLTLEEFPIVAVDHVRDAVVSDDVEQLVNTALAMRPDLRAAEIAIETAGEQAGLARHQFMNLDAIYDANGSGSRGFESGPGLRFTIPIFNRNRGGIAIATAQWQKVARQYVTVRDRVTLEVRTAHTQLYQARENLRLVQAEILPSLESADRLARKNYEDGGSTYFLVLQTTGPYLDARMRESLLLADVRRATAELERSVGMRLAESFSMGSETEALPEIDAAVLPELP